jgi:putative flavoprotein involved in K+ transport
MEQIDTLIIGGGQAGLVMSHALSRRGREHCILERGRIAERWRSERWDGLHFQTPNLLVGLPDYPLAHDDPNGFASTARIAEFLTGYASFISAPVRQGVAVTRLARDDGTGRYRLETSAGPMSCCNVVVATGPFQRPVFPPMLPRDAAVLQIHAAEYRAPAKLPAGAVLVIGAGASGAQIAEELMRAARKVFLSVSRHRRAPRRYRGHDHVWWWVETGMVNTPPDRRNQDYVAVVHTGAYGGHTIDFRDYARQGMTLLGRAEAATREAMTFAADLADNLAHGDAGYLAFLDFVDEHVARKGMCLAEDPAARVIMATPAAMHDPIRRLDFRADDIGTVIWATGYDLDFGWIDIPVLDQQGAPVHEKGVTRFPGLYFIGLSFLSKLSSSFLIGVAEDAEWLAENLCVMPRQAKSDMAGGGILDGGN